MKSRLKKFMKGDKKLKSLSAILLIEKILIVSLKLLIIFYFAES